MILMFYYYFFDTVVVVVRQSELKCSKSKRAIKIDPISNYFFHFHAVKEFLEKCKSEFEEKWNHPKHVSVT